MLDLRSWNLEKDGALRLDGEWEFCRGAGPDLPADKKDPGNCGYVMVPGLWKDHRVSGAALPRKGRGVYRLTIMNGPDKKNVTLTMQRVYSDFQLRVNGKVMDKRPSGEGSRKKREDYIFVHNKRVSAFPLDKGANEIAIHLANTEYKSGGIGSSLLLQDPGLAANKKKQRHTANMIVVGLLLAISIYNFMLYFFRRKESASLIQGLFSLVFAVNIYNVQAPFFTDIVSYAGNPFLVDYTTVVLIMCLCLMTVRTLFPEDFSTRVMRISQVIAAIFFLALLFLDFRTAQQLMKVYYVIFFSLELYCLYVFVRTIVYRRDDAVLFSIGFIPVLIGGINDMLYETWIIKTTNIAQYGMVVFCISVTMVVTRRFSRALREVEKLSRDLTEKNLALTELDRLKDQFLANTSHELRTPLHGMIGLTESMLEDENHLPPGARDNLELIASSGHRLASMVNDLLDMARMQEEGLSLNLRPVDLHLLSEAVVKLSAPLMGGKHVRIVNRIDPSFPRVRADEDRIRQVLYNLIGNAVKFTNRGTIELSARVTQGDDEVPGEVEVSVSDTGIGVPDVYREKIFEAYQQVDTGDTRTYAGTGLGLAIAKRIIEMHGGRIWVEPGREHGSVFLFTLPRSHDPVPDSPEAVVIGGLDEPYPANGGDGGMLPAGISGSVFSGNPVLLVVDDDPINVRIIRNFFESRNCVVKTAYDGISALDILKHEGAVDLVLLDIMMPVMSGHEVCRAIRQDRPADELPVIMLTAKNMMADIQAAFEAGANDYIVKPFHISELLARVTTMLRLRNVRRSAVEGITIRDRATSYPLRFEEITHITSHSKSTVVHTVGRDIEVPVLLKEIVDRLPPDLFIRIHKSHVVNVRFVHSMTHVLSGRYRVQLRDEDDTELPVGPAYLESLRKKI